MDQRFNLSLDYRKALDDLGWLGEDVWLAHCVHLNEREVERLGEMATGVAHRPSGRRTWPPFQAVGEQLFRAGFAGILAPSAARPRGLVSCIFDRGAWPPAGCRPLRAIEIHEVPPPPTGMTT